MVVGTNMKIFIGVSLLPVDFMGKRAIRKKRDKNIQKGDGVVPLGFYSELDVRGRLLRWLKKEIKLVWP
jgi:hypothetical protein